MRKNKRIEKLKQTLFSDVLRLSYYPQDKDDLCEKINELIDAVNELQLDKK